MQSWRQSINISGAIGAWLQLWHVRAVLRPKLAGHIAMGVDKGEQGRAIPHLIFTHSLLNLTNFKNSSVLVVNSGFILMGPPEKISADALAYSNRLLTLFFTRRYR